MITDTKKDASILIVDDYVDNLKVLGVLLSKQGYNISVAQSGQEALAEIESLMPDIVLLDIMMPNIDGYETCQQMKANHVTAHIPVIFLTAKIEAEDIVKGFELGAVDYITKPFNSKELLMRVKNHLELKFHRERIQNSNIKLEEIVKERTQALEQARDEAIQANRAKSRFLNNMSHELLTPMHQILSFAKFGEEKANQADRQKLKSYFEKIGARGSSLVTLLKNLLDLSQFQFGKVNLDKKPIDLNQLIYSINNEYQSLLENRFLTLTVTKPTFSTIIQCDPNLIKQLLQHVLTNAIQYSKTNGLITITYQTDTLSGDQNSDEMSEIPAITVAIADQGLGIPTGETEKVFESFIQSSRTNDGSGGRGLGLAISKEIIKKHGGNIYAELNASGGTTIYFTLPISS